MNVIRRTILLVLGFAGVPAWAQPGPGTAPWSGARTVDATAGSPAEASQRILDLLLSPTDTSRWLVLRRPSLIAATTTAQGWLNTARSRPDRDGSAWQGRGLTAALAGGFLIDAGIASLAVRPIAFVSQNLDFDAFENAIETPDYQPPSLPGAIDAPYRMGPRTYGRVAPGESHFRIGVPRAHAGFSTETQQWGPAHYHALVLNADAGGFPRAFVALRTVPVGVGTFDGEWLVGRLEASDQAVFLAPGRRSRLATAARMEFAPRGMTGLRLGATRFFHVRWEPGILGWSAAAMPFRGLLKATNPTGEDAARDYNQLASLFARIAPPGAGVEVYGELYREDHNYNSRDLAGEPDHISAYTLGIRRAWRNGDEVRALTVEGTNGRITHLVRVRDQSPVYAHGSVTEGHTYLGQPLGSSAALGGGALTIGYDAVGAHSSRFVLVESRRAVHDREGGSWDGVHTGVMSARAGETRVMGKLSIAGIAGLERYYGRNRGVNAVFQVRVARSP